MATFMSQLGVMKLCEQNSHNSDLKKKKKKKDVSHNSDFFSQNREVYTVPCNCKKKNLNCETKNSNYLFTFVIPWRKPVSITFRHI